jgi:hypothetical protein
MDTHIAELTGEQEPPRNRVRTRIFLPGEAGAQQAPPHDPPILDGGDATVTADPTERHTASPPDRWRRRNWLLATAAVLAVAGAGLIVRTHGQNPSAAPSAAVPDLVAPSATVARAPQPVQLPPPQRQQVAIPSNDEQLREILALRDRSPGGSSAADRSAPAPATLSSPIPAAITAQVASPPAVPAQAVPAPVLAQIPADGARAIPATVVAPQTDPQPPLSVPPLAAFEVGATPAPTVTGGQPSAAGAPVVAPPTSVPPAPNAVPPQPAPAIAMATQPVSAAPASRSLSTPSEVIGAVTELRAAPMTPAQQIEVLNLVTRLGVVVRDMRAENAALKARVESTADRFDAAVTDFERRLALAEARGAVDAAMGAPPAPSASATDAAVSGPARAAHAVPGTGSGVRIIPVSDSVAAGGAAAPRYRVAAASPGLAMLSLLDRSGGEGSQLQIAVGDQVPGYGRVTAIQQRGSAWIVQTDKGPDKGVIQ